MHSVILKMLIVDAVHLVVVTPSEATMNWFYANVKQEFEDFRGAQDSCCECVKCTVFARRKVWKAYTRSRATIGFLTTCLVSTWNDLTSWLKMMVDLCFVDSNTKKRLRYSLLELCEEEK